MPYTDPEDQSRSSERSCGGGGRAAGNPSYDAGYHIPAPKPREENPPPPPPARARRVIDPHASVSYTTPISAGPTQAPRRPPAPRPDAVPRRAGVDDPNPHKAAPYRTGSRWSV